MSKPRDKWEELKSRYQDDPEFKEGYEYERFAIELGEQIRAIREARGLSQAELGGLLGLKEATIERVEAGDSVPSARFLQKFCLKLALRPRIEFQKPAG
jgi:HTH-type transcriptional regulator/antitoxin HipB